MPLAQSILEWCQSNKQDKSGTGSWAEWVSSETIYYPTFSWREAPTSYGVGDLQDVDVQNGGQRLEAFKSWRIKEYSQYLCPGERHLGCAVPPRVLAAGTPGCGAGWQHRGPSSAWSEHFAGQHGKSFIYGFGCCYCLVSWKSRAIDLKLLFYILS